MSPILILGGGGLLARELGVSLQRRGIVAAVRTRAECDVTIRADVARAIGESRAHVVINCAAYNSVDRAEREPDEAMQVNAVGVRVLTRMATALVHYSTDFVFDGTKRSPYLESDLPGPLSAYARSKAEGDEAASRHARHLLLRVGCLYGRGGKGFASTLLGRLRAGGRVCADGERRVQPTWARRAAEQTCVLLELHAFAGLCHAMCHGDTTWAEFARELARQAGLAPGLVDAVPTSALSLAAARPPYALLENRVLASLGADRMGDWRNALTAFLAEELPTNRGEE